MKPNLKSIKTLNAKLRGENERNVQQIIGREGETAALLSRRLFTLNLRVIGFAPRQLNRSIASCEK